MSNDRYAVAADALQKSSDRGCDRRANDESEAEKNRCGGGGGGYTHSWNDGGEYEMKVSRNFCYQAGRLVRNVAGAARRGVGECVSVSVHSVTLG